MRVVILGKYYEWLFCKMDLKKDWGECDPPNKKHKQIRIAEGLSEIDELDTSLHEMLHPADYDKTEEWVDELATDMARILWKLGYRRVKD